MTTMADAVVSHVAELSEGIRVESARDYVGLWGHRIRNLHSLCWPGRAKIVLLRSGHRAMGKMVQRLNAIPSTCSTMSQAKRRVLSAQLRYLLWVVVIRIAGLFLPGCSCRKDVRDVDR